MRLRPLNPNDIAAVLEVQRKCYSTELIEAGETFEKKMAFYPEGCLGIEEDGELGAYVFCHPWIASQIVPLDFDMKAMPDHCDCLYIHDISVVPAWRGRKVAAELLASVFALARRNQLGKLSLVAVQSSEPFWAKQGFHPVRSFSYSDNVVATHMIRNGVPA